MLVRFIAARANDEAAGRSRAQGPSGATPTRFLIISMAWTLTGQLLLSLIKAH